jgi:hypothetical protein
MAEQRLLLGKLLVDASIITQEQLEEVLLVQKQDGRKLGALLVERGLINETQLTQILSQQLSVPWVSLYHVDFSKRLLSLVPSDVAEKYCLVPIYVRHVRGQGDTLYVAMDDPTNDEALKTCSVWAGLPTRAMIASPTDIRGAIRLYYGDGRRNSAPPPAEETAAAANGGNAPSEQKPSTAPEQTSVTSAADEAAPAAAEPASPAPRPSDKPAASIPPEEPVAPEPASAAAWKPAAVQVDAWTPDDSEFASPPPTPEARAAEPQEPSVAKQPDAAEQPAAEPAVVAPEPTAAEQPAATEQPAAAQEEPPAPQQAPEPDDQVTLEVGAEIPLEQVLPAGKSVPSRRAMTGAERLMSLTLLDGTTLALPVRRLKKRQEAAEEPKAVSPPSTPSRPPQAAAPAEAPKRAPRELLQALGEIAEQVQAGELDLGHPRWTVALGALITLLVRKGLIDEHELTEELKKL